MQGYIFNYFLVLDLVFCFVACFAAALFLFLFGRRLPSTPKKSLHARLSSTISVRSDYRVPHIRLRPFLSWETLLGLFLMLFQGPNGTLVNNQDSLSPVAAILRAGFSPFACLDSLCL
jgi:hypothetical protein